MLQLVRERIANPPILLKGFPRSNRGRSANFKFNKESISNECRISFHPDDNFTDYVYSNNVRIFSDEDAALYNRLMDESFDVCKKADIDIYNLAYEILTKIIRIAS